MRIFDVSTNEPPLGLVEIKRYLARSLFADQDARIFTHEEIFIALGNLSETELRTFYFRILNKRISGIALQTAIVAGFVGYAKGLLELERVDLNHTRATEFGTAIFYYTKFTRRKVSILRLLVEYGAKAEPDLLLSIKSQSIKELHLFMQAGASINAVLWDSNLGKYYFSFYHKYGYQGGNFWDTWGTPSIELWREYMVNGIDPNMAGFLLFRSQFLFLLNERPRFHPAALLAHLYNWDDAKIELPDDQYIFSYAMFHEVGIISDDQRLICPSVQQHAIRVLHAERMIFMRRHAFRIGIAFQSLQLPALVLLEILDATTHTASFVPMHHKWNLIVAIKHAKLK